MSDSIPAGAVPIGSKLWFFKSGSNSQDVLISAHGGYYKGTKTFRVPNNVEIIFYGEHGKVLSDPGVKLADFDAVEVERIGGGGQCVNYELSKYQGRHGGSPGKPAETYEKIAARVAMRDESLAGLFNSATTSSNQKIVNASLKAILQSRSMSVVTIRNRWNSKNVYLKDLVEMVLKAYPGIRRFHCSFCRSLVGDDNAETAVVKFR